MNKRSAQHTIDSQDLVSTELGKFFLAQLFLLPVTILLPTAPQAILTGSIVLGCLMKLPKQKQMLTNNGHHRDKDFESQLYILCKGFLLFLTLQVVMFILQVLWALVQGHSASGAAHAYLRLIGKQGLYGAGLILSLWLAARLQQRDFVKYLRPIGTFSVVACAGLVCYMLLQRYYGIDWVHGWQAKIGEHRFAYGVYRASGVMGHPLTMAFNCMLLSTFSFAQALWLWLDRRYFDAHCFLIAFLTMLMIQLTGSRLPLILTLVTHALTLTCMLVTFKRLKKIVILSITIGFLVLLFSSIYHDRNIQGRFLELLDKNLAFEERFDRWIFWKVHLLIAKEQPFMGLGLGNYDSQLVDYYMRAGYTDIERKYSAHNIFLQTLADSGIVGIVSFSCLLLVWWKFAWSILKRYRYPGFLMLWLLTLMGGLFQNNLRDSEYLFALWTLFGFGIVTLQLGSLDLEPERRGNLKDYEP